MSTYLRLNYSLFIIAVQISLRSIEKVAKSSLYIPLTISFSSISFSLSSCLFLFRPLTQSHVTSTAYLPALYASVHSSFTIIIYFYIKLFIHLKCMSYRKSFFRSRWTFFFIILSYYKSYILRLSSRLSNLYSFHTFASSFQLLIIVKFYRLQIWSYNYYTFARWSNFLLFIYCIICFIRFHP